MELKISCCSVVARGREPEEGGRERGGDRVKEGGRKGGARERESVQHLLARLDVLRRERKCVCESARQCVCKRERGGGGGER